MGEGRNRGSEDRGAREPQHESPSIRVQASCALGRILRQGGEGTVWGAAGQGHTVLHSAPLAGGPELAHPEAQSCSCAFSWSLARKLLRRVGFSVYLKVAAI